MSIKDWKAREKEQRRSDIIDGAEKLFFAKGYEGVSMDEMAKEINLGKATLYRYFPSKESLFFAVVLRGAQIQHSMIVNAIKDARTGVERYHAAGSAVIEFKKKYPEYNQLTNYYHSGRFDLCGLLKGGMAPSRSGTDGGEPEKGVDMTDVAVVSEIARLRAESFEIGCDALRKGREDGTIQPGMDEVELAILLSILVASLVNVSPEIKCLMEYKGVDHDQFIADARAFIYKSIQT